MRKKQGTTIHMLHGKNGDIMPCLADECVDSIVTDPPSGTGFMGKDWDCFRRRHNPQDVGRDNVMGRMSAHAPHSYGESDRANFIAAMTLAMRESLRVLKPGGHALIWALPRTSHWTATAIEDAGFEIRDVITHHFGSGFPKSQDVGAFIDKLSGAERAVVGVYTTPDGRDYTREERGKEPRFNDWMGEGVSKEPRQITAPATDAAKQWDGWGTALKPATEHWILARKPLSEGSIARNVLKHGVGGLNIDACRVEATGERLGGGGETRATFAGKEGWGRPWMENPAHAEAHVRKVISNVDKASQAGRFPPNVLFSHSEECGEQCAPDCPVAELDRQSGQTSVTGKRSKRSQDAVVAGTQWLTKNHRSVEYPGDSGGASRFFPTFRYQAKPPRSERESGLAQEPTRTLNRVNPGGLENEPRFAPIQVKNNHPTVKGKRLMAWLIQLITPPGGLVLDPFAGSGSTGVAAVENGYSFIGIEQDRASFEIAAARIRHAAVTSGRGGIPVEMSYKEERKSHARTYPAPVRSSSVAG